MSIKALEAEVERLREEYQESRASDTVPSRLEVNNLAVSGYPPEMFSRNEITLSTSASLGSLSSGSPGFAPDGPDTPGTGSPRARSSFFSVAFSPCRRAISVSSAERSSRTTLQAQPESFRLQCDTWPVRGSSRSRPLATGLKL